MCEGLGGEVTVPGKVRENFMRIELSPKDD